MKTKKLWYLRTHIVSDCETIVDEWKMFRHCEDAEKSFNNIVKKNREIAINKNFVVEFDDNLNFQAFEEDNYEHNHITVAIVIVDEIINE